MHCCRYIFEQLHFFCEYFQKSAPKEANVLDDKIVADALKIHVLLEINSHFHKDDALN